MTDMPETILVALDKGMLGTGRWMSAGTENVFGNTFYTRTDTIAAALIEAERRGMMRAAEITWPEGKVPRLHNKGFERKAIAIRQAAGELK